MTRDQLQTVLNLASYELDAMVADQDTDTTVCQQAFDAVKKFWADWGNNGDDVTLLTWPRWQTKAVGTDEEESE